MKAILEFSLPDDQDEYEMTTNALRYYSFIHAMNEYLRGEIKYQQHTDEEFALLEKIRDQYFELMNNYDIKL